MKKAKSGIYSICLLVIFVSFFGKVAATEEKAAEVTGAQKAITRLAPILIYVEDELIKITLEDIGKYHGDICVCLVIGVRAAQLAISKLWKDEIPKRGDFKIISACPTDGNKDAFEFITRAITREKGEDFSLRLPEGIGIKNMSGDAFTFTFIRKSNNKGIKIRVKEGVFPKGFFELRNKVKFDMPTRATLDEKRTLQRVKQRLRDSLIYFWPAEKIFDFKITAI